MNPDATSAGYHTRNETSPTSLLNPLARTKWIKRSKTRQKDEIASDCFANLAMTRESSLFDMQRRTAKIKTDDKIHE